MKEGIGMFHECTTMPEEVRLYRDDEDIMWTFEQFISPRRALFVTITDIRHCPYCGANLIREVRE